MTCMVLEYPGNSALRQFFDRKHRIEHFDGKVSIYLHDPEDVRLLREHFPLLIANVQRCIDMIGKIGISREYRR